MRPRARSPGSWPRLRVQVGGCAQTAVPGALMAVQADRLPGPGWGWKGLGTLSTSRGRGRELSCEPWRQLGHVSARLRWRWGVDCLDARRWGHTGDFQWTVRTAQSPQDKQAPGRQEWGVLPGPDHTCPSLTLLPAPALASPQDSQDCRDPTSEPSRWALPQASRSLGAVQLGAVPLPSGLPRPPPPPL